METIATKFLFPDEDAAAWFILNHMGQVRRVDEQIVLCLTKEAINDALKVAVKLPKGQ